MHPFMSRDSFFFLPNLPFFALIAAVLLALWEYKKRERSLGQIFTHWLLLLPVGVGGIWWFLFEFFFPKDTAFYLGWSPSLFERQLAFGDLSTGIVAILAFFRKEYVFSLAAGIGAIIYIGGIALFHMIDLFYTGNLSLGNTSWTFSCDVITSVALVFSLYSWHIRRPG